MADFTRMGAAEDGLKAIIDARPALADVARSLGWPGSALDEREHIWIDEDVDADQEWEVTGQGAESKKEEFHLRAVVWKVLSGDDYVAARNRAIEMAAEVERAVLDDPKLNGSVWDSEVVNADKQAGLFQQARAVMIIVTVKCTAFLS